MPKPKKRRLGSRLVKEFKELRDSLRSKGRHTGDIYRFDGWKKWGNVKALNYLTHHKDLRPL